MIDRDFEQQSERATLLSNKGYFSRYRELSQTMGVMKAWEQVEKELPLGLTRYTTFSAFEAAKRKEKEGRLNTTVYLRYECI